MASDDGDYVFEKTRIEALTDGIFAVTMTFLVLELKLPERPLGHPPIEWEAILDFLEPRASAYVVSFFVLCVFWMGHVRLMRLVRHVDHRFLWLSLAFILRRRSCLSARRSSARTTGCRPSRSSTARTSR
ncbi:MAG TPA: TMEM175 family protein [Burkholderiales bacterium]|nr:TMEM175 family protein [Burkholderiales bacterium]